MKYQRILFVLSVPILVLFIIVAMLANWRYNYADFSGITALGIVLFALAVLVVLTAPGRGLFQAALRLIVLSRNMWDHRYGARPLQPGEASGAESTKSKRTFGSTIGGHVAHLAVGLKQIVSPGSVGRASPRMVRVTA